MATFKVGQRVRVVSPVYPENMNRTGTVMGHEFHKKGAIDKKGTPIPFSIDLVVNLDGDSFNRGMASWQLEPAQKGYDGNTKTTWEELEDVLGFDILEGLKVKA